MLAIAGDVWIGRAAGGQLVEKMLEDALAILGRESHRVQRDAEIVADATRILQVGRCRAVVVFVFVPVAHEKRVHVIPRALQQHGGNGGIDAAGDREDYAGGGRARFYLSCSLCSANPPRSEGQICARCKRSSRDLPPTFERQTRARCRRLIRDLPPELGKADTRSGEGPDQPLQLQQRLCVWCIRKDTEDGDVRRSIRPVLARACLPFQARQDRPGRTPATSAVLSFPRAAGGERLSRWRRSLSLLRSRSRARSRSLDFRLDGHAPAVPRRPGRVSSRRPWHAFQAATRLPGPTSSK